MAIRINGQDFGPIQFTDDRPGKTIHIGPYLPTSVTDGDVWFDSDTQNNAGKNLLQTLNLATIVGRTVNVSVNSDYKDVHIVLRGLNLSATATLTVQLNNDLVSYVDESGTITSALFTLAGIKAGLNGNKFTFKFEDTQDSSGWQFATAEGGYRSVANAIVPFLRAGVWVQTQPMTSVQLTISAGGFAAGTMLVYGVN